jgi:hypothetical protein
VRAHAREKVGACLSRAGPFQRVAARGRSA